MSGTIKKRSLCNIHVLFVNIMVFSSQDLGKRSSKKRRGEEKTLLGIKLGASVLVIWP